MTRLFLFGLMSICAIWCVGFLYLAWAFIGLPRLEREKIPIPGRWPRLSVIVPACNEAKHLDSAVKTLLHQDYPEVEIILVNDRSSDETGAVIDALARRDARVCALHIETLPNRWLGKVHALHCGVAKANGDWLLFTDADVFFAPGALRRALSYALHTETDHLALIPRTIQKGVWLDVAVQAFGLLFLLATRAAGVNRSGSKSYVGIGAFNLVRAEAFRRTPGFEWLRLEPADDVGLGMMIKQASGRSRLALAHEHLTVEWYPSVLAMFRGLEKNLFGPSANYQWWLMLAQVFGLVALAFAPWVGILLGTTFDSMPLTLLGATTLAAHGLFAVCCAEHRPKDVLILLLIPLGLLLIAAMHLRAGCKCLKHGGIDWRGTHYPVGQLRRGQRVKFLPIVSMPQRAP